MKVSGKETPLALFTIFAPSIKKEISECFKSALKVFTERNWTEAENLFQAISKESKELKTTSLLYLDFIAMYRSMPPSGEWQGEIAFESK